MNVEDDEPLDLSLSLWHGSCIGKEKVIKKVIKKEEEYYDGDLCLSLSLSPSPSPSFYYGTTSIVVYGSTSTDSEAVPSSPNNQFQPEWTFTKHLSKSDCDKGQARLLLNKPWVKNNVIENELQREEAIKNGGIPIDFFDWDEKYLLGLKLKSWVTGSYVLTENWIGGVCQRRGLHEGDKIGLHWDRINRILYFAVLERKIHPQI
ncbi:putative B3 domain-containing protein At1g78640 [Spinacia oleracea]|uniref:B3 domain-containing protein At1g78640 n=1 Tax=Spinacia oleracea TaxID=3562 RepID=A0ABM3RFS2_SPIOL|nr:putative B3 domain-containing protein At1g78640 [Spinacia oleracea]